MIKFLFFWTINLSTNYAIVKVNTNVTTYYMKIISSIFHKLSLCRWILYFGPLCTLAKTTCMRTACCMQQSTLKTTLVRSAERFAAAPFRICGLLIDPIKYFLLLFKTLKDILFVVLRKFLNLLFVIYYTLRKLSWKYRTWKKYF